MDANHEYEALRPTVLSLLEEGGAFRTDVYPPGFHGLYDRSDERGGSGEWLLQFYTALSVLAHDMHVYLLDHPRADATRFEEIVHRVHLDDEQRWPGQAFPTQGYWPREPFLGLAAKADSGTPTLEPLGGFPIHEWNSRPGALLYRRSLAMLNRRGLRARICGEGGLYPQYLAHNITAPDLHSMIVYTIMGLSATAVSFWAPWATLITLLLVRRGLRKYCGAKRTDDEPARDIGGTAEA
jgi:hypothetical protein